MKHFNLRISIIILIGIDMVSKYMFYDMKYLEQSLFIHPAFNTGIARSLPMPFVIIIPISIIGIAVFVWLFIQKKINRIIAVLLIAGAMGNLIDRIFLGGVRDFININIFNFPIFNIADIMLSIGVFMRIARIMLEKRK